MFWKNYRDLKSRKIVSMKATADPDTFIISRIQFDPDTGESISPNEEEINKTVLELMRTNMVENLADINEMLADINRL